MTTGVNKGDILTMAVAALIAAVLLGIIGFFMKESWIFMVSAICGLIMGLLIFAWMYISIEQLEERVKELEGK